MMMKYLVLFLATWFGLLTCLSTATATDDVQGAGKTSSGYHSSISSDPEDPRSTLKVIKERRAERDSLFPVSPLKPIHDASGRAWDDIYQAANLRLGLTFNHLFQWLSDALPGKDKYGTTTDLDFIGSWEVLHKGKPTQGEFYFHIEGRWDYGTTGPQTLGFDSLGSAGGTANGFARYDPTFLPFRNLYWEQGSKKAGWAYRTGKITPDSILATSQHISPVTTFLPNVGTGLFSSGYPDSGLGAVGVWYTGQERYRILGLVSDANGDRQNFGDIGAGDFYKAFELGVKIAPRTEKAGYSKFTIWHTDGTKDGQPINAQNGPEGWGFTIKLEQELTGNGQTIGVFRYGRGFNEAAIWKQQAGASFLFYNPPGPARLQNDVIGVAGNWLESIAAGSRDEYNVEFFYRFPLFPGLDTRLSFQQVINPANTREIDNASVFSLGFRVVF